MHHFSRNAFTLIELLVVIAIIAILSVVVILTLNPAEILRQGRDSNRVSDMSILTSAFGTYTTDQSSASSFSLGSSSVIYVSIPDPSATSTAGDQCQGLGLITLPAIYSYHCAASSTYHAVDGTGWIPVNFKAMSSGSPLGNLAVDPTNVSSSKLYYTYTTNGSTYEVTSAMESQKYGVGGSNDVISNDGGPLASVYEKGTKLGLEPLDYGDNTLVGYWPLNEGTGTIAYDFSGNNATGSWSGTQVGTNGYYTTGAKVGPYAGDFDGSTNYISIPALSAPLINGPFSVAIWFEVSGSDSTTTQQALVTRWCITNAYAIVYDRGGFNTLSFAASPGSVSTSTPTESNGNWHQAIGTYNGSVETLYLDGGIVGSQNFSGSINGSQASPLRIGNDGCAWTGFFNGFIDDLRIYNRALSATQVAALYNGAK